jgi:DNA-binding response OmpR family regulator
MLMADILVEEGYDVRTCSQGEEALEVLEQEHFDLVLSDIKMPRVSGIDLLLDVRKRSLDTEVILITAYASVETAVEALRGHAFDYIEKPFALSEFRQRVRRGLEGRTALGPPHMVQVHDNLAIDHSARRVWVDNNDPHLTRLEFDVLAYLFARQGCIVSPEELLLEVWHYDEIDENSLGTVKACIHRLRNKIKDDAKNPRHILNIWGRGYQLGQ